MKNTSKIILYFSIFMTMFCLNSCKPKKDKNGVVRNWHFTFKNNSKEPYGTQLAFDHLKYMFPDADIKIKNSLSQDKDIFYSNKLNMYIGYDFKLSDDEFVDLKKRYFSMFSQSISIIKTLA